MTITRFLLTPEGDMTAVDTIDIPDSGSDAKTPVIAASDSAIYVGGYEAGLFSLRLSYAIHLPSVDNARSK